MRVLVLSDIHANFVALESVLADAKGSYDTIWCLGDVIGYGPSPNECVEFIRSDVEICVIGNHDWAGLGRPGINVDAFNPQARQAVLWTREQLKEENRAYLDSLPDEPLHPKDVGRFLLTHASPREPVWEYVMTPSIAMENFAIFDDLICLVGHTHKPAIYRWRLHTLNGDGLSVKDSQQGSSKSGNAESSADDGDSQQIATVDYIQPPEGSIVALNASDSHRLILNPGSVGQPRDNDARAAYAILDIEDMTWQYFRVPYPVELTQSQMRAAKLPKRLIDRLSFGW